MNAESLYAMLTSPNPNDVTLGMSLVKSYKGTNKKLNDLVEFYKMLRVITYPDYSSRPYTLKPYPLSLKLPVDLNLEHYHITKLPDNLEINGNLNLTGNKGLKKLQNNLTVKGVIFILGTKISSLPKNLRFRSIYVSNILIEKYKMESSRLLSSKFLSDLEKKNGGEIINGY